MFVAHVTKCLIAIINLILFCVAISNYEWIVLQKTNSIAGFNIGLIGVETVPIQGQGQGKIQIETTSCLDYDAVQEDSSDCAMRRATLAMESLALFSTVVSFVTTFGVYFQLGGKTSRMPEMALISNCCAALFGIIAISIWGRSLNPITL